MLIFLNIIDFKYRFYVLVIVGIISFIIIKLLKVTNTKLGLTGDNTFNSIKRIIPITLLILIFSIVYYFLGLSKYENNETIYFYLFYIIISCPIQELIYRGILNEYLSIYNLNIKLQIIIASLLFSFLHVIYKDSLTLLFTFIIGLYWNYSYLKDKNLIGVTISHIMIGIATIFLGLI
jgi:membrane protease YdiL (CAAX protease family)